MLCQKSYTQTGSYDFAPVIFILSFFGMQGFERGSFPLWLSQFAVGRGSFLLDWGTVSHLPPSRKGLFRQFCLKIWWYSPPWKIAQKRNDFSRGVICLFLLLLTTPAVAPACLVVVVSWTSPEPSLLHLRLLGPPWPQLFQVPGQLPLTFAEIRHWHDPHSCFLRGLPSAFPIPQPRSPGPVRSPAGFTWSRVEIPARWPIRFLLDKCVWLLAVLLFFTEKLIKAGLTLHDPAGFLSQAPGLSVGLDLSSLSAERVWEEAGTGHHSSARPASPFSSRVEVTNGTMFSFTQIVFFPPLWAKSI